MDLPSLVNRITANIIENEKKRKGIVSELLSSNAEIRLRVEPDPLEDLRVAAVDGGLLKRSFHGFDCILLRAAAVCFTYGNGNVTSVSYHPSKKPYPKPEVMEGLSDIEFAYFYSIRRMTEEVRRALESLERFSPDMLLMDGPLIPHYSTRPAKGSELYSMYEGLVDAIKGLCERTEKNKTILAGVVEDSRSQSFISHLMDANPGFPARAASILEKTRDTELLHLALCKGERSPFLPYSSASRMEQEIGVNAFSFYLKTCEHDRPLRVEFLGKNNGENLARVLLAISGHHPSYGLPAPLIEADSVAKLSEEEMERFYMLLLRATGGLASTMRLRREQRPF